ncbi:hypothetical protein WICANDRAFT_97226 [Wickerhamomyces anomalus NRRL Y-366-8]|uniref:C2H2-type domain-containing protein n=1 Tax=Wickerhamomyces anomalus (strain ATCC 58044 / CBS 1984 / NCYC 433 / NRRL Y-366-8) TaxID=683960 RepID=A0A1E3NXC7_WICAA|nr:uncharacterized protein WICANDRAFT_97226 [Wickerhamomyces anomalus NRRL Y-366-8]ODQ57808.1 hypothetical protein WICANDRAFT_97226 [Wickerhamomyces anomalus NRRL Y-366-8]
MSQILSPSLGLSSVVEPINQQQHSSNIGVSHGQADLNTVESNENEDDNNEENGETKFNCPHCDHKFTRKHNLKSHLLIHTKEKPFSCSICSSKFRRLHDLKRHEKLHTGEKPYQCKNCGRKFARCDALVRHNNSQSGCTLLVDDAILKSRLAEDTNTPQHRSRASSISSQVSSANLSAEKQQAHEINQWRLNNQLPSINRLTPLINPIAEEESHTQSEKTNTTAINDDELRKNNHDLLPYVRLLESRVASLETKLSATETKLAQLTYTVHNGASLHQQQKSFNAGHNE